MSSKLVLASLIAAALGIAAPADAQQSADSVLVYRREVYRYAQTARPDPFRSLLRAADLGLRFEDLRLKGVVYDPDPQRSVAIFGVEGSERRIRARPGDRLGGMSVVAIQPRRVDLLVDDLGVARRESLLLKAEPAQGSGS